MSQSISTDPFVSNVATLSRLLPERLLKPRVGIVCGSGLSTLASSMRDVVDVPYAALEGFGKSTVPGHKSILAFGLIGEGEGVPVVAMLGRFHPYEGHPLKTVGYPIRLMARLGVKDVIITNAVGSLNPSIPIGTIVVIHDHIALPLLTGLNPLFGPQTSPDHARFIPLSDAYSRPLRVAAFRAAHALQLSKDALAEGTYAWVSGPTYETPAEGRFLRAAGGDVAGMSTIPEVVTARDEGLNVLVLSLVTNKVVIPDSYRSVREEVEAEIAGLGIERPATPTVSHEEVLAVVRRRVKGTETTTSNGSGLYPGRNMVSKTALTLLQLSLVFAPLVTASAEETTDFVAASGFTISFGYIPTGTLTTPTYTPSFGIVSSATINPTNGAGSGWAIGSSPACYGSCQAEAFLSIPPACGLMNPKCQCDPDIVTILQTCLQKTCSTQDLPFAETLLQRNCPSASIPTNAVGQGPSAQGSGNPSTPAASVPSAPSGSSGPSPSPSSSSGTTSRSDSQLNPSSASDNTGTEASGAVVVSRVTGLAAVAVGLSTLVMAGLVGF
ncbi:hypothetical protein EVG20_g3092 [Dentipellis fragilis]|uniref:purine-nucleoside phosphorylase n=1 Tax=Dentipellis fragilis TaxID=205917 RepID=A0A4Y9Z4S9_9AGAM|nr:hypothetical protein EVG20_g3092 [Dentipellis fragilis]